MKKLHTTKKIIYWLILVSLVTVTLATVFTVLKAPGGYQLLVVQSGSMEPKIQTGSMVLIAPRDNYQQNDVITFRSTLGGPDQDTTVTHRIIEISETDKIKTYITKGDANEDQDRVSIRLSQIIGKVIISVPFLGYVISFSKTPLGFLSLIVLPATLIIYGELINIKQEVIKLISTREKKAT